VSSVQNGDTLHRMQVLTVPRMLHGIHSVSSMSCSCGAEILGDRVGERPFCLLLIHSIIMMNLLKYFSDVSAARSAKQKHHHDTQLIVNTQFI